MNEKDQVSQIKIETINDTGKGLEGVSANFENFDKQLKNLEKNLNPIQKLLDGGLVVSTSVSGLASLGKTSGNLSAAMEDLKKNLLGISGPASEANTALSSLGTVCSALASGAAMVTQFFTAVRAGVEISKKTIAAIEAVKTIHQEYNNILKVKKAAVAEANKIESVAAAVEGANAAATTANSAAKEANTGVTVANSAAEAANATATAVSTAAEGANAAATTADSVAKGTNTGVTAANSVAQITNATSTAVSTTAQGANTIATGLFWSSGGISGT